jgi:hypothetical protein
MVTQSINAVMFKPGHVFEGFTIGDAFRTGEIKGFNAKHEGGAASLYCRRERQPAAAEVSGFKDRARRLQSFSSDLVPAVLGFGYSEAERCFWLATEEGAGIPLKKCFEISRDLIGDFSIAHNIHEPRGPADGGGRARDPPLRDNPGVDLDRYEAGALLRPGSRPDRGVRREAAAPDLRDRGVLRA